MVTDNDGGYITMADGFPILGTQVQRTHHHGDPFEPTITEERHPLC